jgi:undecaprenyl-diphosphatase
VKPGRTVLEFGAGVIVLVAIGLGLRVATAGLGRWDAQRVAQVAQWRGPAAIEISHLASWLGRSWIAGPLAAAAGLSLHRGRRRWVPLCAVLAAVLTQNIVKVIVRRPRPNVVHLEHVSSWSFPSGHATEATALFVGVTAAAWPLLRGRRSRAAAAGAAVAGSLVVAGSRVVLGVHYPTDVAAGVVLGVSCVGLALLLSERIADQPVSAADWLPGVGASRRRRRPGSARLTAPTGVRPGRRRWRSCARR